MQVNDVISLLSDFVNPETPQQRRIEVEEQLLQISTDPDSYGIAISLLDHHTLEPAIWFAHTILQNIISIFWVPRSMHPDPSTSPISAEMKQQTRAFFTNLLMTKIDLYSPTSQRFIFGIITYMIKVDFSNDGQYWFQFCRENFENVEKRYLSVRLLRYFSDELQAFSDHSLLSSILYSLRQSFTTMVSEINSKLIDILLTRVIDQCTAECFGLISSLTHWLTFSPGVFAVILEYSHFSKGEISLEAHKCIKSIFLRRDVVLNQYESGEELICVAFQFFMEEMHIFESPDTSPAFIQSLIEAFHPFASSYFFTVLNIESVDEDVIIQFLTDYERYNWAMIGTPHFQPMFEIWMDLLHGTSQLEDPNAFKDQFIGIVEHSLESVSSENFGKFSEDDLQVISDVVNEICQFFPEEVPKIIHRATAFAINNSLTCVDQCLIYFYHSITLLKDNDPVNGSISDSMLQYLNRLLTKQTPNTTPLTFELVHKIILQNVHKFTRNSEHFLEKKVVYLKYLIYFKMHF